MAVTNQYSTQYTAEAQAPKMSLFVWQSFRMLVLPFDFTQGAAAGDATSTVTFRRIPPGVAYFFPILSRYGWSAFGAARTLAIGYSAYTDDTGTAVVANTTIFDAAVDVSLAGDAAMGSSLVEGTLANTGQFRKFASQNGVDIIATVAGGTIPAAAQIHGSLVLGYP